MTILVLGKTGQLAHALSTIGASGADDIRTVDRVALDLMWPGPQLRSAYQALLDSFAPVSGVINAAAYTAVDRAEEELQFAKQVNGYAPSVLATVCAERDVPFIHVSTDYVFNGKSTVPYTPDMPSDPINAYGASKRLGEIGVMDAGGKFVILRTSWVYDGQGKNFLTTMLRLAATQTKLTVVADQIGRPTYAPDLAEACLSALRGLNKGQASGLYHVSNSGPEISWADFARAIFKGAALDVTVGDIPSSEFPTPAARPNYSVMDLSAFETDFDYLVPTWDDGLSRALASRTSA